VALSYLDIPKVETFSLSTEDGKLSKLSEITLDDAAEQIQSVRLCPEEKILLTAKDETTVSLNVFMKKG
jgi:hypothetical protein